VNAEAVDGAIQAVLAALASGLSWTEARRPPLRLPRCLAAYCVALMSLGGMVVGRF